MKKTLIALLCAPILSLVGCDTMNVTGSIGYVDPGTGAKGGMTFTDDGNAGWWIKVPWTTDNGSGVAVVEGEIPVTPEK